jgi:eukaryotic-like serine/threonine-protein kinase
VLLPGTVIDGRYRLGEALGKGAMGAVWAAEHVSLGTSVAMKTIHADAARHQQALVRFEREAILSAQLNSRHVVKVLDHGDHEGLPYIVMERLYGETLRDRLKRLKRLPVDEVAILVRHVARGLTSAHDLALIHRDIKPENIYAAREDDEMLYKIFDFGVAKVTDALAMAGMDPTKTGALLGTPSYLCPEQARGQKDIDHRADIWSLGVVAFECLTGRRPFHGRGLGPLVAQILQGAIPTPSQTAPDAGLGPEIDEWMARCIARDPKERFRSAREMAEAFPSSGGGKTSMPWPSASGISATFALDSFNALVGESTADGGTLVMEDPEAAATLALEELAWYQVRAGRSMVGPVDLDQVVRGRQAGKIPDSAEARLVGPWLTVEMILARGKLAANDLYEIQLDDSTVGPVDFERLRRGRDGGRIPDAAGARMVGPWQDVTALAGSIPEGVVAASAPATSSEPANPAQDDPPPPELMETLAPAGVPRSNTAGLVVVVALLVVAAALAAIFLV